MPRVPALLLKERVNMNKLHQVYVGIGSNIKRRQHISSGIKYLRENFGLLQLSPIYVTKAVGFDGDDFFNLVAGFESELNALQIEQILKQIEHENGRDRNQVKFSARTLDIDLLLYDDLIMHEQGISVPRDEILKYAFVLKPLSEIAGELIHPETGHSIQSHWNNFNQDEQRLENIAIDF